MLVYCVKLYLTTYKPTEWRNDWSWNGKNEGRFLTSNTRVINHYINQYIQCLLGPLQMAATLLSECPPCLLIGKDIRKSTNFHCIDSIRGKSWVGVTSEQRSGSHRQHAARPPAGMHRRDQWRHQGRAPTLDRLVHNIIPPPKGGYIFAFVCVCMYDCLSEGELKGRRRNLMDFLDGCDQGCQSGFL